jgi:uncharacterized Tic20 family protein
MSEPYVPYPAPQNPPALTNEERTWGCAAHWSALVGAWVALAFLGPLLVLLVKGNESPYVRRQAVESLNFQLSVLIYGIVSAVLVLVLIGFILLIALGVLWLVLTILATIASSRGELYRYPLTIHLVS